METRCTRTSSRSQASISRRLAAEEALNAEHAERADISRCACKPRRGTHVVSAFRRTSDRDAVYGDAVRLKPDTTYAALRTTRCVAVTYVVARSLSERVWSNRVPSRRRRDRCF